ncbi:aldehyde dehydrogenase family protein [Nocardia carnea]|uniref:aldehyde dehydrogenase family protein n=1 Tax=Nocardia carnea TaxID=37328 RepID=UPI0024571461|nr:aldehyde dehydrogenase family protein [Nocardia carnea]
MAELSVWSLDVRTGERRRPVAAESDGAAVDRVVGAAHAARAALADRATRARFLRTVATTIDTNSGRLVTEADAETALGDKRLTGEVARTSGQLRMFADVVDEGEFLGIIIDHADPAAVPPRPDLRRYRIPLGVVAVYAASNFPFAFSVAGGDTASALAAGCPVVVKAHPDHPATSELMAEIVRSAAVDCGLPADVLQLVHGFEAGVELIRHPLVAAAGFTGSVRGGRALFDAAAARPAPIPFHGELGSLNPVIITRSAAAERGPRIAAELADSATLGNGQFCVKPGLVFLPAGADGDEVATRLAAALSEVDGRVLLDDRLCDNFVRGFAERAALPRVDAPLAVRVSDRAVSAGLLTVDAQSLAADSGYDLLLEECFGPVTVLARYGTDAEVVTALDRLPGTLTATLQISEGEESDPVTGSLPARLSGFAGRIVVNAWPTGVAVTAAQHHGGPYPASTSTSTSVGTTAIERWLRPVAYQNAPDPMLPPELREDNPLHLPRLVDGIRLSRS